MYRELKRKHIHRGSRKLKFMHQNALSRPKLKKFPYVCNSCFQKSHCSKDIIENVEDEADKKAFHCDGDLRSH